MNKTMVVENKFTGERVQHYKLKEYKKSLKCIKQMIIYDGYIDLYGVLPSHKVVIAMLEMYGYYEDYFIKAWYEVI